MNGSWKFGIAAVLAVSAVTAAAATPEVIRAIAARQANYKEIGGAFKTINDEVRTGAPDMATVRPLARDLATRAARMVNYFPRGSGPESGIETRAMARIWAEQTRFNGIQQRMVTAARALNTATTAGNLRQMREASATLGETCRSCHDRYREEE